jgi:hypothetical protein
MTITSSGSSKPKTKRYYLDTEFIEDGHTINLISLGICAEDGRELYVQNQECDFRKANDWVLRNVLTHLNDFDLSRMEPIKAPPLTDPGRMLVESPWHTRAEIAQALLQFCDPEQHGLPQFWGYYADYDWVVVCQIFGTMMQLPKDWPQYCRDLKQWCDDLGNPRLPETGEAEHHALADALWNKLVYSQLDLIRQERRGNRALDLEGRIANALL